MAILAVQEVSVMGEKTLDMVVVGGLRRCLSCLVVIR